MCERDRAGEIAALEAKINDLQDRVDAADEAQTAALALDDELASVHEATAAAEARKVAALATLESELSTNAEPINNLFQHKSPSLTVLA